MLTFKKLTMKKIIKMITTLPWTFSIIVIVYSCSIDKVQDPDGPSVSGVQQNASKGQLNELVVGIESTIRDGLGVEVTASGTMAR